MKVFISWSGEAQPRLGGCDLQVDALVLLRGDNGYQADIEDRCALGEQGGEKNETSNSGIICVARECWLTIGAVRLRALADPCKETMSFAAPPDLRFRDITGPLAQFEAESRPGRLSKSFSHPIKMPRTYSKTGEAAFRCCGQNSKEGCLHPEGISTGKNTHGHHNLRSLKNSPSRVSDLWTPVSRTHQGLGGLAHQSPSISPIISTCRKMGRM